MTMKFYNEDGTEIGLNSKVSADEMRPSGYVSPEEAEAKAFLDAWDRIKPVFKDRNGNDVTVETKLNDLTDGDRAKFGLPDLEM